MIPKKFKKQIGNYYLLEEAVHPKTEEVYKIGDKVVLVDDNIICGSGKQYIETINTMFCIKDSEYVYCSEKVFDDSDYKAKHWTNRPQGYYLNSIKRKISNKEINKINRAKSLSKNWS